MMTVDARMVSSVDLHCQKCEGCVTLALTTRGRNIHVITQILPAQDVSISESEFWASIPLDSDFKKDCEEVLEECKDVAAKRRRQSTRLENLGIPEEELLRQQQELFARARAEQEAQQQQVSQWGSWPFRSIQ